MYVPPHTAPPAGAAPRGSFSGSAGGGRTARFAAHALGTSATATPSPPLATNAAMAFWAQPPHPQPPATAPPHLYGSAPPASSLYTSTSSDHIGSSNGSAPSGFAFLPSASSSQSASALAVSGQGSIHSSVCNEFSHAHIGSTIALVHVPLPPLPSPVLLRPHPARCRRIRRWPVCTTRRSHRMRKWAIGLAMATLRVRPLRWWHHPWRRCRSAHALYQRRGSRPRHVRHATMAR
jgi:hypothetical protein